MSVAAVTIEQVFREESGQAVATLVRLFGDIDVAEEAVQEAFLVASERWPATGVPPNPAGWIVTTARNRAIDRFRREASRHDRQVQALDLTAVDPDEEEAMRPMQDDRLGLIFMCCHPALAQSAQVALTLRLLGGLQTPEIARAFLVPEPTMAQRLVRAKKKISAANIPYRIPERRRADRPAPPRARGRLPDLQRGPHRRAAASSSSRDDLCREAVRLARLLAELMPDEPEVNGLLALLLLTEARRPARTAADGSLVLLPDQDRSLWDRALIAEGHDARARVPAPQPARAVPDPGRDQRRPHRRRERRGHRLGADPRPLRPAARVDADARRRAQPRGRARRGRRPRGRPRGDRGSRARRVPPLPRRPRRPARTGSAATTRRGTRTTPRSG